MKFAILCIILMLSSCDHLVVEGNTTSEKQYYIHWFAKKNSPQTCFIQKGENSAIFNAALADKPAEFSYGKFRYKSFKKGNKTILQIINLQNGKVVEENKISKFIYLIYHDKYIKKLQTEALRLAMQQDYKEMGGTKLLDLIN